MLSVGFPDRIALVLEWPRLATRWCIGCRCQTIRAHGSYQSKPSHSPQVCLVYEAFSKTSQFLAARQGYLAVRPQFAAPEYFRRARHLSTTLETSSTCLTAWRKEPRLTVGGSERSAALPQTGRLLDLALNDGALA